MARTGTHIEGAVRALLNEVSVLYERDTKTGVTSASSIPASLADSGLSSTDDVVGRIGGEGLRCPMAVSWCRALLEKAGEMVRNVEVMKRLIEQVLAQPRADLRQR